MQKNLNLKNEKIKKLLYLCTKLGPVAQLDRVSDYGSEGWGFDSSLVHKIVST